jgi:hypothetical protein
MQPLRLCSEEHELDNGAMDLEGNGVRQVLANTILNRKAVDPITHCRLGQKKEDLFQVNAKEQLGGLTLLVHDL